MNAKYERSKLKMDVNKEINSVFMKLVENDLQKIKKINTMLKLANFTSSLIHLIEIM